jgi:aminomethyltransferase
MSLNRTPLYDRHVAAGAKLADFYGWELPVHYGSQVEEHHQVRNDVGLFDVCHMNIVDIEGPGAEAFLRHLLANDVARLKTPGKALYSCMCNEDGGVVDDLIVYRMNERWFRTILNAATHDKDLDWLSQHIDGYDCLLRERTDLGLLAVQGPRGREVALRALGERGAFAADLKPFVAGAEGDLFVGRTGYTGEDGFEIGVPIAEIPALWDSLVEEGAAPVGYGARDTLRLEAAMALYGHEMDENVSPLEAGLGWTVAWEPEEREFIGRLALEGQRDAGVPRVQIGLVLEGRGVLREGQTVHCGEAEGVITSGTFSPTLGRASALARVPAGSSEGPWEVAIRNRRMPARVVKPPFARNGEIRVELPE